MIAKIKNRYIEVQSGLTCKWDGEVHTARHRCLRNRKAEISIFNNSKEMKTKTANDVRTLLSLSHL